MVLIIHLCMTRLKRDTIDHMVGHNFTVIIVIKLKLCLKLSINDWQLKYA